MSYQPRNPDYRATTTSMFDKAPFVVDLGIEMLDCGPGWCESELTLKPRHMQHHQYAHAGVMATIADHTAGAAAGTLVAADETILSVEFKVDLMRPGLGQALFCRAEVVKPGRTLSFVRAEVFAINNGTKKLVSKSNLTMAILPEQT